ncbi:MAG: Bacitracin transport permease protein BCRC [Parcubacteria group bacterium Licking1014_1]|nr:MAG: Bacitracin transport permease protein BCRC [Parcubacteria group bacterium Licking1014_1]
MNLDLYLFNLVNGFVGRWLWLDYLGMFLAQYFEYFLLVILSVLIYFWNKSRYKYFKESREVWEGLVAIIVSRWVSVPIIRFLWFRPRPFVVENFIPLINQSPLEASFPSGHAAFYFALSTTIYLHNKKAGVLFYIASLLIVLARVFAGAHWPSDILAGAVLGILTAWTANKVFKKI